MVMNAQMMNNRVAAELQRQLSSLPYPVAVARPYPAVG